MIIIRDSSGQERPLGAGVYLISRRKIAGPLTHYGVLATGFPGLADEVVDLTDQGVRHISFEEFAHGLPVSILEGKPHQEAFEVIRRARGVLSNRPGYDSLGFNCEHMARLVFEGEAKSTQVNGVATVAALVVVGLLLSGGK